MKEFEALEQLMVENKDVLVRLKESNPEDYTAEKFLEGFKKSIDKSKDL